MTRSIYRRPWRIDLDVRDGVVVPIPLAAIARIVVAGLQAAGAPRPASIGLILADDAELAGLNATHMGKDGPTDVLSFPLLPPAAYPRHEGGQPADASAATDGTSRTTTASPARFALPPDSRPHLGDVVVSVERAAAQATEGRGGQTGDVRWSVGDELRLLVTHGVLHVCGWDHAEPVEEAAMRALERRLLERTTP